MYRVMLVDDEESILKSLGRLLRSAPCYHEGVAYALEVEAYTSPLQALERIRAESYALVLSDYRMPELDGAEFLRQVRAVQPEAVRMILSGYADLEGLTRAINEAQISRFIAKPWNDYELVSAIGQALAGRDALLARPDRGEAAPVRCVVAADGALACDDTSNWYG